MEVQLFGVSEVAAAISGGEVARRWLRGFDGPSATFLGQQEKYTLKSEGDAKAGSKGEQLVFGSLDEISYFCEANLDFNAGAFQKCRGKGSGARHPQTLDTIVAAMGRQYSGITGYSRVVCL